MLALQRDGQRKTFEMSAPNLKNESESFAKTLGDVSGDILKRGVAFVEIEGALC